MNAKLFLSVVVGFLVLLSSCTENIPSSRIRTIHIYSDVLSPSDDDLFYNFERINKIDVQVHCLSFFEIQKRLKEKRYSTNIDMVLLGEPRDFKSLQQDRYLYHTKVSDENWQPLAIDPLVFLFENDSTRNFTTYGQIARGSAVLLEPSRLLSATYLPETIEQITEIYKDVNSKTWSQKLKMPDSLLPKKTELIRWAFHSELKPNDFRYGLYPDQRFFGAVGKSVGVGVIHNCPNLVEARKLFEWCRKEKWRNKLAKKMNIFSIINNESNKDRYPYIYQNFHYHQ
ncbi:MAG: hypothetical protein KJ941_13150 [Bacteroidetes bacterium]|nr:hypothetical protein [Bacteroidota bacterium]